MSEDNRSADSSAQGKPPAEWELALKDRELALKERGSERELALKERELALKEREAATQSRQNRWSWLTSPAVVAIVAGLIGYIGTLVSSYSTRRLEADRQTATEKLEQENREATLRLAREKQEGMLILEAIKTGGTAEQKERLTAANLVFLADAGLITSIKPERLQALRDKAGTTLPSLPSGSGSGVEFERSSILTAELQSRLQTALAGYQTYLKVVGYDPGSVEVLKVTVDEQQSDNAYFDNQRLYIGSKLARDPEYTLSEYTWYVLKQSNPQAWGVFYGSEAAQFQGFGQALKFYLVCSHLDTPYVGRNYYALIGVPPSDKSRGYLFDLSELRSFDKKGGGDAIEPHRLGEVWGGAFWEIRAKVGREKADRLVFAAWKRLKPAPGELNKPGYYVAQLLAANTALGQEIDANVIREAFARRKLE
jgi:FlaG/FlaF family flagellin (archaellin)